MHPQNKMPGSDPFYFHFIFIFFILKGAPAPQFYFCTPDGGLITVNLILQCQLTNIMRWYEMPCANRPYDMRYHRCCRSLLCPCCKLMASAPMPGRGKRPNLEPIGTRTLNIQSVKAWVPEAWQPHILRLDVGGCWRMLEAYFLALYVLLSEGQCLHFTWNRVHALAGLNGILSSPHAAWPILAIHRGTVDSVDPLKMWGSFGHSKSKRSPHPAFLPNMALALQNAYSSWWATSSKYRNKYVKMTWKLPALGAGNLDEDKAHGWDILRLKLQDQGILETKHPKGPTMNRRPTWLQFSSHDNRKHSYSKHGVIVSVRLTILQYVLAWKLQGLEAPKDRLSDYWWLLAVIIVHHSTHCCQWRRCSCFGKFSLSGQRDCAD